MNNFGYIKPEADERDYIFGGASKISGEPLTDGHWLPFIPDNEIQRNDWIDSYNCTAYGTSNCLEVLFKRVFNEIINFSDRFIGIIADTKPPGNSPKVVIDAVRKQGLIREDSLPFSYNINSIQDYYSPKPPTSILTKEAEQFLSDHGVGYELVKDTSPEGLKEALKFSPLGIAVKAWSFKDDLYYFPPEADFNHWTCLLDYVDGKHWIVFDSYPPFIKNIAWDTKFDYTLRYWLGAGETKKLSIYEQILQAIAKLIPIFSFLVEQKIEQKKTIENPQWEDSKAIYEIMENKPKIEEPEPKTPDEMNVMQKESLYKWDTPAEACHSFRTICDEVGLSVNEKNMLAKVLNCESGFNVKAVHKNNDARQTTDFGSQKFGVAQFNNFWYKDLISPDEALNDPEKAVRLFIDEYQAGRLKNWVCFKTGRYQNFPSKIV